MAGKSKEGSAEVRKVAFVICPLDKPDSETRKRSNQILRHIIKPVVEELGYEAVRSDNISEPGIITYQIVTHLVNDPLVIADLSNYNPNVFYELGVRHAFRKPVVQIIERGQRIPFDVSGLRTIELDTRSFNLDSVENAKRELRKHIKAVEKGPVIVSPVATAADLETLKSGRPEQEVLATILQRLEDLPAALSGFYEPTVTSRATLSRSIILERLARNELEKDLENIATTKEGKLVWVLCSGTNNISEIASKVGISHRAVRSFIYELQSRDLVITEKRGYPKRKFDYIPSNWGIEVE